MGLVEGTAQGVTNPQKGLMSVGVQKKKDPQNMYSCIDVKPVFVKKLSYLDSFSEVFSLEIHPKISCRLFGLR